MRRILFVLMLALLPTILPAQQVRTEASNNRHTRFTLAGTDTLETVTRVAEANEVRYIERLIFMRVVPNDTTLVVSGTDTVVRVIQFDTTGYYLNGKNLQGPYSLEIGTFVRGSYTLVIRKKASEFGVIWRERY